MSAAVAVEAANTMVTNRPDCLADHRFLLLFPNAVIRLILTRRDLDRAIAGAAGEETRRAVRARGGGRAGAARGHQTILMTTHGTLS
jgi:hypothetical protein